MWERGPISDNNRRRRDGRTERGWCHGNASQHLDVLPAGARLGGGDPRGPIRAGVRRPCADAHRLGLLPAAKGLTDRGVWYVETPRGTCELHGLGFPVGDAEPEREWILFRRDD